jgi:hypothetical protein
MLFAIAHQSCGVDDTLMRRSMNKWAAASCAMQSSGEDCFTALASASLGESYLEGTMKTRDNKQRILAGMSNALAMALVLGIGAPTAQAQQIDASGQQGATGTGNPFLDDAKAAYQFRTATFKRWQPAADPVNLNGAAVNKYAPFNNEAAGIGGWIYGNTGELANFLSFSGSVNFTVPLWSPKGDQVSNGYQNGYNYILTDPDQQGFVTIGEAAARLRYETHTAVLGWQAINYAWYLPDVYRFYNKLDQAMVGRRDVRAMQPLTYLGATVGGKLMDDTVRYFGGYLTDMRQINDTKYRNMYQSAFQTACWDDALTPCTKQGDSNGMAYAGMQWKPNNNSMYQAQYYNVENVLNMGYVDGDWVFRFGERRYFRLGLQWMYQSSSGDSLSTGNGKGGKGYDFSTNMGGIYLEGRPTDWFIPYAMAGVAAKGAQIQAPYSIGPSYLVQRIGENSKAGEKTWILGTTLDFASWGLTGLSFDINYGQRSDRKIDGDNPVGGGQPLADWDELATDLIYVFPKGTWFQNLRARARYAKVWLDGAQWVGNDAATGANVFQDVHTTQQDVRFDLQFVVPFK